MEELIKLLKKVPDKYEDFVAGIKCMVKDDEENMQKVIDFIKEDPTRRSDDIIEYLVEELVIIIQPSAE